VGLEGRGSKFQEWGLLWPNKVGVVVALEKGKRWAYRAGVAEGFESGGGGGFESGGKR